MVQSLPGAHQEPEVIVVQYRIISHQIVEIFSHASAFVALDSDGANVPADGTLHVMTAIQVLTNEVYQGT